MPAPPQVLARQSAVLLRQLGNLSANYELSAKDLAEHRPVVEAIATALEPFTERLAHAAGATHDG